MATTAGEMPYQERSLFVRKATGLVRGWSVQDAFIYATFSINLIRLSRRNRRPQQPATRR